MIEVLEELVKGAVTDVFGTMLSIKTEPDASLKLMGNGNPRVASSVGFIGQITGVVFIYSEEIFAKLITSRMLGMDPSEIDCEELVNDSMGELGNMVVGHIKSRLCDRGMPCVLTIPSIVRGSHFCIEPTASMTRVAICFRCGDSDQLAIEVLIKKEEELQP